MNHESILTLIAELYGTVTRLAAENAELRKTLDAAQPEPVENGHVAQSERVSSYADVI